MVEVTVARTLELAMQRAGSSPAVIFGDQVLTYGDLNSLANRLANALIDAGLCKGDRLGVVLPNCPDYIAIALACARSGIVMVPLNYRFTSDEYAFQLSDCGARALIYSDRFAEAVRAATGDRPDLIKVCLGQPIDTDFASFTDFVTRASNAAIERVIAEDDLFYLGYTSGTTGHPKGAKITHRNRALAYHYWALEFGIRCDDVILHAGPFHHTAPFTFVLTQLFMGGRVVILDHFDPKAVLEAIERHKVTWEFLVPYMLDRLIHAADEVSGFDVSSLRMIISGASPLPSDTKENILELFPAVGLHEFYGATEAGVITNLRPADQKRKTRCVGRPVFDTEIDIRDQNGISMSTGESGDIWMRGPTIFSGYFNAAEKTAEVFSGDWCTIGDVGRLDEEGYLYILDRSKDVIKSGGVNVFPIEIEEVLRRTGIVDDVAVIGVPDKTWGEAVHAVVVMKAGHVTAVDPLLSLCRERLAGYKVPKSVEFRDALPRNANGKVLKRTLRQEFVSRFRSEVPA